MSPMMWKSAFREIRQTMGRFCSILAIIALGVSFFAGLKITQDCMVTTTQDYLQEKNFYNFRIISTVGYDAESVERMAAMEDVRSVAGGISVDILCTVSGSNQVAVKAMNLTDLVNETELTAGRLPEADNECVVDNYIFDAGVIGENLVISQENAEDDLNSFVYDEYTVVGLVQSPLYIQYERGNTSLGDGKIDAFIFIPEDGFDLDYYTEVYVKFDEDLDIYSDDYDKYIDGKKEIWEELSETLADERYLRVMEDAQVQLEDAQVQLDDGREEGAGELADAWLELVDASYELNEAGKEIDEAQKQLDEAAASIEDWERQIEEGEEEIRDAEAALDQAQAQVDAGMSEYQTGKIALAMGKMEADSGQMQLYAQSAEALAAQAQINAAQAQIDILEEQLNAQEALLNASQIQLLLLDYFISDEEIMEEGFAEIESYRADIEDGRSQLSDARKEVEDGLTQLEEGLEAIDYYQAQLDEGYKEVGEGEAQLEEGYLQLLDAQNEIYQGRASVEEAKIELAQGKIRLIEGTDEYNEGQRELDEALSEWEEGWQEYQNGLKEYRDGKAEYDKMISDAEEELANAEKYLEELEEPDSYVLGRETNVGYVCFENDSGIVSGIANVFPVFFFAVAALVCITTMDRMVEEQRTQIGVLKAIGYSRGAIIGIYLFYSGLAAFIGWLIGFFGGTLLFPKVIWAAYSIMYNVSSLEYVFSLSLAMFSLAVSMICSIGATWVSCRSELSEVAAELMRPKAPKAGKRVALERVNFIWSRMKFLYKVSYRNIFRYRKRFFMMIIGIGGCTALLVTGFGLRDSIMNISEYQYEDIFNYDVSVMTTDIIDENIESELEEVIGKYASDYVVVMENSSDLTINGHTKSVYLVGTDENNDISPFITLYSHNGEAIDYPTGNECVIPYNLAQDYDISIGDDITIQDENMHTFNLTVSGINVNYIYNYIYISAQSYEEQTGELLPAKTLYINLNDKSDGHALSALLMKADDVASVSVVSDSLERFDTMMSSMNLVVLVVILCAAGLAFIVLYNLTNINITERIREIATIKVLGFNKKETESYVFRENIVLAFIGALAGLLVGKFLHAFVMSQIKVDMVYFDARILPVSYLLSFFLTLFFTWMVNHFMGKKLDGISMTESLKSVD